MIEEPQCPACGSLSWQHVRDKVFTKALTAAELALPPDQVKFLRRRRELFFDLWVPDRTELTLHFVVCNRCGFVCFKPRPTLAEVDAKYRSLGSGRRAREQVRKVKPIDISRSAELFDAVSPHLGSSRDLLDFGGGGGALLHRFIEHGLNCAVVDYQTGTIRGAEWLARTLDEVPAERKFDAVMASHVFEHLAEPLEIARQLRQVLRPDGLLFVEVPMDLRGRPPLILEPLTHINFFCQSSLTVLLECAGFRVLSCRQGVALLANGNRSPMVQAVARVAEVPVPLKLPGSGEALRLMKLRRRDRLVRAAAKAPRKASRLGKKYLGQAKKTGARSVKRLRQQVLRYLRG